MASLPFLLVALLCALLSLSTNPTATVAAAATDGPSAINIPEAVRQGITYFRAECHRQQALMPSLLTAVRNMDLSASQAAYVAARPPYEQIETLANAFSEQDRDIDARPYAFHLGEDDPHWRGFHVLERAIYRERRLDGMFEVAVALNASVNSLCALLKPGDTARFNARVTFTGAVALAFEVPAKKVASEEETWSDLSLMIFRNNYRGIWSQVEPFLHTMAMKRRRGSAMRLRTTYRQVRAVLNAIDPMHDFDTSMGDARPYSSVTTAERATIITAAYDFATALEAVRDDVFSALPKDGGGDGDENEDNGDKEEHVVGNMRYTSQVKMGLRRYLKLCHVQSRLAKSLTNTLVNGDLAAAKRRYEVTRPPYEQIETLAGDFPTLDGHIDQRPYAVERGELDADWRGFHLVERALFRDGDIATALKGMQLLNEDIGALCAVLQDGVNGSGGSFKAARQFDGMITLAYEVPAKKISSEEETWSNLSVMIFRENIKGIWAVFEPFKDVLPRGVAHDVEMAYMALRSYITYVVDKGNDFDTGFRFAKYSDVPVYQRQALSEMFYTLGRALRKAKVALKHE